MSEIITKAQRIASIIAETTIEPWKRAAQGLEAFSGVTISDLDEPYAELVETELVQVNHVLSRYDLETSGDYASIDDADIAKILGHIETATNRFIDSEVSRVMDGLRDAKRKLPEAEIREVRQHKDVFVPLLIEAMERAVASARAGNEPDGQTHFFAAFLLTEFEVDAAFPIIIDAFIAGRSETVDLLGDAVHSLLPAALALFSRNNTDKIDEIVRNTSIDMPVRWSVSKTYIYLVRDGMMTRDAAVEKLHEHLVRCMAEEDLELIAPIIGSLSSLAAAEALATIIEAFQQNLVDTFIADLKTVETLIFNGNQTLQRTLQFCDPTGMPDTIAVLSQWASFSEKPATTAKNSKIPIPASAPNLQRPGSNLLAPLNKLSSDTARVGRNDPCPCGSGKKFKKCCMR